MTDPRTPAGKTREEQLPDDLDQSAIDRPTEPQARHGSEDARLLTGESTAEGDVPNDAAVADTADDPGPTND